MAIAEQLVLDHKTPASLCCIVMFETYARPSEALALTTSCITSPLKGAQGTLAATSLVIRARDLGVSSKTGCFDVSVALGLPRQVWVGRALSRLARSCPAGARLLEFDHHSFGRSFAVADAAGVGPGPLQACLYSLRHGGASHDRARQSRSVAAVQLRGGWRCFESVRRYEKHALIGRELQRLGRPAAESLIQGAAQKKAFCAASCAKLAGHVAAGSARPGSSFVSRAHLGRRKWGASAPQPSAWATPVGGLHSSTSG